MLFLVANLDIINFPATLFVLTIIYFIYKLNSKAKAPEQTIINVHLSAGQSPNSTSLICRENNHYSVSPSNPPTLMQVMITKINGFVTNISLLNVKIGSGQNERLCHEEGSEMQVFPVKKEDYRNFINGTYYLKGLHPYKKEYCYLSYNPKSKTGNFGVRPEGTTYKRITRGKSTAWEQFYIEKIVDLVKSPLKKKRLPQSDNDLVRLSHMEKSRKC